MLIAPAFVNLFVMENLRNHTEVVSVAKCPRLPLLSQILYPSSIVFLSLSFYIFIFVQNRSEKQNKRGLKLSVVTPK